MFLKEKRKRMCIGNFKRNPSKYDAEERGDYYTWLKHNRKQMNAGTLKPERVEKFRKLLEMTEQYRRKNQWE